MRISIITATYNSQSNIADCLKSVSDQSYHNIEHIVIDGGSTDNTLEIINSFKSVSQVISEPDQGIYDALNKGIRLATGDIIGFLHSDDMLATKDTITNIINVFKKDSNVQGVYGNLVFIDPNNSNKIVRTWQSKTFNLKNVKYGWMPPHPTLFLKNEIYKKHGVFDHSFKIAGDYDFMLRVMLDEVIKLHYLSQVITKMRMGGVSTGSLKQIITKSKEDIKALKNNGFKFPLYVLVVKNLRKLPQLITKYRAKV